VELSTAGGEPLRHDPRGTSQRPRRQCRDNPSEGPSVGPRRRPRCPADERSRGRSRSLLEPSPWRPLRGRADLYGDVRERPRRVVTDPSTSAPGRPPHESSDPPRNRSADARLDAPRRGRRGPRRRVRRGLPREGRRGSRRALSRARGGRRRAVVAGAIGGVSRARLRGRAGPSSDLPWLRPGGRFERVDEVVPEAAEASARVPQGRSRAPSRALIDGLAELRFGISARAACDPRERVQSAPSPCAVTVV
jgi:hypothetical protein